MVPLILRLSAMASLCLTGCQSTSTMEGNGQESRRLLELERPVTAVSLVGNLTADLLQLSSGGTQEASLSGDENLLGELEVIQHEGQLSIRARPGVQLQSKVPLKLVASLPFDTLHLRNSATARLRLSGRFLKLSLADAASVDAVGRLGSLEIDAENFSRFDFGKCPVREASIQMKNSSHGIAEVRSRIHQLEVHGSSHLDLLGSPRIEQQSVARDSAVTQLEQDADATSSKIP